MVYFMALGFFVHEDIRGSKVYYCQLICVAAFRFSILVFGAHLSRTESEHRFKQIQELFKERDGKDT
jgi:hypothetical protein